MQSSETEINEPDYSEAVVEAVDAGNTIQAIRLLREETGLGLREAKDEIDRLAKLRHPGREQLTLEGGMGGFVKLVISILVVAVAYALFFVA